ncbi:MULTISPECIES: hypothetical protein [Streptomyces]|uniref:Secreted protein n=1 Tax=Streptomyces tricolor TaxID=68277 RepID=A0ABS9JD80_9ACTN|nr:MULTISPECIES: hypothetical protein [Streptomyces]MCG0063492.1 hypothetical protein [Streptomyces tricolor]BCM68000.1 hypothetical protein EASAB2608_03334 [Streptomyces sp. EAS-AB2608]
MTPRLRLTLRCVRLLVVLTAAALPAYGTAVAYGGTLAHGGAPVHAGEPDSARPSATGHQGPQRPAENAARAEAVPEGTARDEAAPEGTVPGRGQPERGRPEESPAGRDGPDLPRATPAASADRDASAAVPMPSDSASASVRPFRHLASVEPSRAGSRAGEGRMRPGRPDGPAGELEGDGDPPPATPVAQPEEPEEPEEPETAEIPSASPAPEEAVPDPTGLTVAPDAQQAAQRGDARAEPVLRVLPLGSGLVLIGLGLGLALLGLRLRRS